MLGVHCRVSLQDGDWRGQSGYQCREWILRLLGLFTQEGGASSVTVFWLSEKSTQLIEDVMSLTV